MMNQADHDLDHDILPLDDLGVALILAGDAVSKECNAGMSNDDNPKIPPELGLSKKFRDVLDDTLKSLIRTVRLSSPLF